MSRSFSASFFVRRRIIYLPVNTASICTIERESLREIVNEAGSEVASLLKLMKSPRLG